MLFLDRHDRQSVALAGQDHVLKCFLSLDLGQRDIALELPDEFDIHEDPPWFFPAALRIVIIGFLVELNGVRVGLTGDFHDPDDSRLLAIGMVEEDLITDAHIVAHHIAGLVVADAVPHLATVALEIVDAVYVGFRLH